MKEHYFFGYLYIKSSKVLAAISVVIGMGVCISLLFDWKKTLDETTYKSNPALISSLQRLKDDYDNTKKQALELHKKLMPTDQPIPNLIADPVFYKSYNLADEFADLQDQVDNIHKNSDVLKGLVFKSFEESINYLLAKMRKYAISKQWMDAEEEKLEIDSQDEIPFRLFRVVDFRELRERKASLNDGMTFLDGLLKVAEQDDSKVNIGALSNHLSAYLNILNSIKINVPMAEASDDDLDTIEKKKIFTVMDRLKFLKEAVREVVFQSWGLDVQYEKTSQLIQEELGLCLGSKENVRQVISKFGFDLVWTVLISIVITVSILISSDLLKAVLLLSLRKNPRD